MKRVIRLYESMPSWAQLFIGSFIPAITFYMAAVLSAWVAQTASVEGWHMVALYGFVFAVFFAILVFAAKSFILVREQARVEQEQERETFLHAYTLCDRTITDALRALHAVNISPGELIEKFTTSLDHIQRAVDAAYNTFEAAYGKHVRTEDRIDFEVTFMTKSYLDGHITIPACANRDGRSPRSMVLRRQKPTIYDTTETAAIYRADRPTVRVVENTKAVKTYAELYPGETDRIRSSVIYPVLSESNELLGTLVVHCDKPGFFTAAKEKYWCDLMEVFAKRIALHKRKLDILCQVQPPQPLSIQLPLSKPF